MDSNLLLYCVLIYASVSGLPVYYKSDNILVEEEQLGSLKLCSILGDREFVAEKVKSLPKEIKVVELNKDEIKKIINNCPPNFKFSGAKRGAEIIFPGTKWCGAGNSSDSYYDLGKHLETDICCREHDSCFDNIGPFETKHGIFNGSPFVKSNCDCDNRFYDCLKQSDDEAGHTIGNIYFNILHSECFQKEMVECEEGEEGCTNGQKEEMKFVSNKEF